MTLSLATVDSSSSVNLSADVFDTSFNEALIHQVVTAYLANMRQATKAQKTRSDVRGGGAKPWRQKGTGRARAGTIRSPIWRGGGVTFAAKVRNYQQKVNRKMYRTAMRSILSELRRQERLVLVDNLTVTEPKTKLLVQQLTALNLMHQKIVILTEAFDPALYLAARNILNVDVMLINEVNPVSLVGADKVILTAGGIAMIEELLK
ncbi:MAG: 50S ribosomal protein L4 [Gammaproteobacteria bacterium]